MRLQTPASRFNIRNWNRHCGIMLERTSVAYGTIVARLPTQNRPNCPVTTTGSFRSRGRMSPLASLDKPGKLICLAK